VVGKPKEQRARRISLKGKSHYESTGIAITKDKQDPNTKQSQLSN